MKLHEWTAPLADNSSDRIRFKHVRTERLPHQGLLPLSTSMSEARLYPIQREPPFVDLRRIMGKLDVLNLPSVATWLQDPKCQTGYGHDRYLICFYIDILHAVQSLCSHGLHGCVGAKEDERLIVSLVASRVFVARSWPINYHLIAIFVPLLRHSPSLFCNSLTVYLTGDHCCCS